MNDSYPRDFGSLTAWARVHRLDESEVYIRFAQGEVLRVIAGSPDLAALLVFKGGNALDFVWLPNRNTKDLDFSVLDPLGGAEIDEARLEKLLTAALTDAAPPSEVTFKVQRVRRNPPGAARAFATFQTTVGYALPNERALIARMARGLTSSHVVLVEVSINEIVCDAVPMDIGNGNSMRVSTVEDIIAEKLRAMLQQALRNRRRPQDLLDIASILASSLEVNRQLVTDFLVRKAAARNVPTSRGAFRDPELINRTRLEYDALQSTTRGWFIPFDEALAALLAFVDSLDIPA